MSVTLMHPAKAVGWNEMSFGRDTLVMPSNIVLDWGPGPNGKGRLGDWIRYRNPPVKICIANCGQTTGIR